MKHQLIFLFTLSAFLFSVVSCQSQGNTIPTKKTASPKAAPTNFIEGKDYNLFTRARVLDKTGFEQPIEAFSLLIPKGWKYSGEVMWTAAGKTCAGTNSTFKATSPDGKYSFELFPSLMWGFATDPQLASFQQNNVSKYCSYGEPLDAENYLKQQFLPRELGNPKLVEMTINKEGAKEIQQKAEKYRREMDSYGYGQNYIIQVL